MLSDLTDGKVFFESHIDNKFPIQRPTKIIDAKKDYSVYLDEYSMQSLHRQEAYFSIYKGDDLIGTTQNFSYFCNKCCFQNRRRNGLLLAINRRFNSRHDRFINENKGDFTDWMNARKEEFEAWRDAQNRFHFMVRINQRYFKTIDPGGTMLAELMDARVDIQGVRHNSISDRLLADMEYLYQKLEKRLYTLEYGEISDLIVLQDDAFR